jgi:DNA (cytosine-5)-methyltransferase 1
MTHGSLFSGIGGFELAAEWSGFTNVFLCEIEPFNQRVLKHYWPNSELHTDVKEFPSSDYTGRIDILTGGFPCQPYSTAGKRLGKEDDRHLWPFMLEIIREIAPTYVVGENVRGLVNWSDGLVFEEVCADLEAAGYDVQPFILPAAGVGAPHRRDRVWFIAHADNSRARGTSGRYESSSKKEWIQERHEVQQPDKSGNIQRDVTDTERDGLEHRTERGGIERSEGKTRERVAGHLEAKSKDRNAAHTDRELRKRREKGNEPARRTEPNDEQLRRRDELRLPNFDQFPTQPPICGGNDGLPRELDGITFSKWRNNSIKAYGNAIVPQVAYQIFQAINEYERAKTGRVEA